MGKCRQEGGRVRQRTLSPSRSRPLISTASIVCPYPSTTLTSSTVPLQLLHKHEAVHHHRLRDAHKEPEQVADALAP